MKRGKPCSILEDVVICVQMGWTLDMLESQPVRFIEKLQAYLGTLADLQEREGRRIEEELHRLGRS